MNPRRNKCTFCERFFVGSDFSPVFLPGVERTLWGEGTSVQDIVQLHAYGCYQTVTEHIIPQST